MIHPSWNGYQSSVDDHHKSMSLGETNCYPFNVAGSHLVGSGDEVY